MPYKLRRHVSIYPDEKFFAQLQEIASAEKVSLNRLILELAKIGLSKRQEEVFGIDQIARSIKADLQLQRDVLKKQSNRLASLLTRIGLHSVAARYQVTHIHARLTDGETAKKNAESGWQYAVSKIKEKVDKDNDTKE